MKIIIAGAGDMGFHLAELLSYENQDIVLIDNSQEVLDYANTHLDVLTIRGDAASNRILEQADAEDADLVLAVTTSETTNLITAMLAKKMGARQTVARVARPEYIETVQKEIFRQLGVDSVMSPHDLAAEEIRRLVRQCSFTDVFEFEDGKMNLVGISVHENSQLLNKKVSDFVTWDAGVTLKPIAILRGARTIIPEPNTILQRNDHVYFLSDRQNICKVEALAGNQKTSVKNIMIVGSTPLALATAKRLEKDYNVTLIEKEKSRCRELSEELNSTLIINGDSNNIDLLAEEGLDNTDVFIALTPNSETNIITSLTAKSRGVAKTIAQVENREYIHLSHEIGVDTLINKKLIAANNIFRFVRKGKIEAITSLHGVDAEVIEFVLHKQNQLTKRPLRSLPLPKTALIGGIIRGEEGILPNGDFQLEVNDKVIVFALPEAIGKVEQLFR